MKSKSQKCTFVLIVCLICISISSYSQRSTKHLTRGVDTAEIYLSCQWYAGAGGVIWQGIFHSVDNGKTLSVQHKSNYLVEAGEILGDSVSGALYQIPLTSQDTFGVSFDYGVTFEKKYFNDIYEKAGGCGAGELYLNGWGLYRGTDFGSNFTWQSANDSLRLQDVGTLPGEVYWIKDVIGYNPLKLAYSNDYGQTFSLREVTFPGLPNMFDYCNIHRGAEPGELYFVVWKNYMAIALYHSFDYGQTVTFQSDRAQTNDEIFYTAGRTPGTFYYARREICGTPPNDIHTCLWIYFSRDYGVTFTTYFNNLTSVFTGVPQKEIMPEIKVFPNPASEQVTFRIGGSPFVGNTQITIYDFLGNTIAERVLPKGQPEVTMDIRNLSPGVYYYETIQQQHRQNGKIVVVK